MEDDVLVAGISLEAEERIKIPSCDIETLEITIKSLISIS